MSGDSSAPRVEIWGVPGIPEIRHGDDLAALIVKSLAAQGDSFEPGDIVAISSKVASKALGLITAAGDKEAVVASETVAVVAERTAGGHVTRIVRAAAGPVMAAAGVDASNTGADEGVLLLLPHNPDEVCRVLHEALVSASGVATLGVILTDTAGRPWRGGQTDFALGSWGVHVYDDHRGGVDADGRPLAVTVRAVVDELAAAADLVKGKVDGVPVAIIRGRAAWVEATPTGVGAESVVRAGTADWFALGSQEAVRSALGVPPGTDVAASVGIRPVGSDSVAAQVDRAVGVALQGVNGPAGISGVAGAELGVDIGVGIDVGSDRIDVTGDNPVSVGVIAARLDVALWGEGVPHQLHVGPDRAHISLNPSPHTD